MSEFLVHHPDGFNPGRTMITRIGEPHDTGIELSVFKMPRGNKEHFNSTREAAYLLLHGECMLYFDDKICQIARASVFDDDPVVLHSAAHHRLTITAITDCEFVIAEVENTEKFSTQIFDGKNLLENEKRGKGILNDTAYRIVRTVFDARNRPKAKLVIGEVVNAPGCWSSYPQHHHLQPEIYHYRFTEPQGYGHAECGDDVFKVRQYDTYKILNQRDHSQTAAPGYGMYYVWVLRHLDNAIYTAPEFTEEHSWTKNLDANSRVWKGFNKL